MVGEAASGLVERLHRIGQRGRRRFRRRRPLARRLLRLALDDIRQIRSGMHASQPDENLLTAATAAIHQRHTPAGRQRAEHILECIDGADTAARQRHHFVVVSQPALPGIGRFEDVRHDHATVGAGGHRGAQRGVIDQASPLEQAEKVSQLVGRDGVAHPHVDAATLLERCPPVDADDPALRVEQAAAGVARIDRGVDLQAVGIFEDRAGRKLVAPRARHDAGADRRLKIRGEQKRIAGGEAEITHLDLIAIGKRGEWKVVAAEEFDERHVASWIEAHEHRVVEAAVGQPALHRDASRLHNVKVGERIAVGADEHPRAAPRLPGEDRHRGSRCPLDDVDPLLLGMEHRRRHLSGTSSRVFRSSRRDGDAEQDHSAQPAGQHACRDRSNCRWLVDPLHESRFLPPRARQRARVLIARSPGW